MQGNRTFGEGRLSAGARGVFERSILEQLAPERIRAPETLECRWPVTRCVRDRLVADLLDRGLLAPARKRADRGTTMLRITPGGVAALWLGAEPGAEKGEAMPLRSGAREDTVRTDRCPRAGRSRARA